MNSGYILYFENGATVKDCLCECAIDLQYATVTSLAR